jgi:hypothetical protein
MLDTWVHRGVSMAKGSGLLPQLSSDSRQNSMAGPGSLGSFGSMGGAPPPAPAYGGMQSAPSYQGGMPSVPSYGGAAPPGAMASRASSVPEPQAGWGQQQQQQQPPFGAPNLQQGYGAMYGGYEKHQ